MLEQACVVVSGPLLDLFLCETGVGLLVLEDKGTEVVAGVYRLHWGVGGDSCY
jgi:hypothetical protein